MGALLASPALAQNRIDLVASWVGGRPPDSLSIREPGELKIYRRQGNAIRATVPRSRTGNLLLPAEVAYGSVTLPLLLQVRPNSTRISFSLILDEPESCSQPHAEAVGVAASTQDDAMRRALTAGFMLRRTGQSNTCRDYRLAVLEARHRRYAELARSPDFRIPDVVRQEWLQAAGQAPEVQRAIQLAERQQLQLRIMTLQNDVLETHLKDPAVAAASSRLILAAAEADPEVAEITYGLVGRSALIRQTNDLRRFDRVQAMVDTRPR
jgi:hypothetical protein